MFEENMNTSTDTSLSDEDFLKVPFQDYEAEADRQLNQYEQAQVQAQTQDNYQQNPAPAQQQEYIQNAPEGEGQPDIDPNEAIEAYKGIMQEFKASGKTFKLKDWHDAIPLMQQGIDYTKKQQQLKPRLMEMRALENNNMLGNNLNYAIDLYQGNPEALKKLIRDKKIDINSLMSKTTDEWGNPVEGTENTNYVPQNHRISEEQYDAQEAIDELSVSPKYTDALSFLGSIDSDSVSKFYHEPGALKALVHLMEDGTHDKIMSEIMYAKSVNPDFARLKTYDAYVKICSEMLNQQQQQPQQVQQPQYVQPQYQQPQQYIQPQYQQPQVNPYQQQQYQQQQMMQQRKQSVSPIRNNGNNVMPMYDPLKCSDADFAKIDLQALLRM